MKAEYSQVRRAIFLAAGKGTRMSPLTDSIPKPLIKVYGKPMLEWMIEAVLGIGIKDIVVIRGYLSNKFNYLREKYPQIRLIDNPYYQEANNISSIYVARSLLSNSYVIEGDLFLKNSSILKNTQMGSYYIAIEKEFTDDWCFSVNKNGIITKIQIGGVNCQQMVGISYWTEFDGKKLAKYTEEAFKNKNNWQLYWDQIALEKYKNNFQVRTCICTENDVVEIDTLQELPAIDSSYKNTGR